MLEKWERGGARCLESDYSHCCMRAMNYNVTRALFTGPLASTVLDSAYRVSYMELPRFQGDIGIRTCLYIHSHIVHFRSLAQLSLLALFN